MPELRKWNKIYILSWTEAHCGELSYEILLTPLTEFYEGEWPLDYPFIGSEENKSDFSHGAFVPQERLFPHRIVFAVNGRES